MAMATGNVSFILLAANFRFAEAKMKKCADSNKLLVLTVMANWD